MQVSLIFNKKDVGVESRLDLATFDLPHAPGVYYFLSQNEEILYVGKACDLKKRLRQYFQKNHLDAKTRLLMTQTTHLKITITKTETEALLLENNLIKHHQPKYNILLKDDKNYPYLLLDTTHPFPSLRLYRGKQKPNVHLTFGPFPHVFAAHETLHLLQKCFKIRNCQDTTFSHRSRACLQYQIKRCQAPCVQYISAKDYNKNVEEAIQCLQGKSHQLLDKLTQDLHIAVQQLAFEKAAYLRDKIQYLHTIQQPQSINHGQSNVDIIAIEIQSTLALVELVLVRHGDIVHHQIFHLQCPLKTDQYFDPIFEAFLRFYYLDHPERIPSLLITHHTPSSSLQEHYKKLLKSAAQHVCNIQTRPRSIYKRWLDFAMQNLKQYSHQYHLKQEQRETRLSLLEQMLHLTHPIQRIDCFDISHTHGSATMGAYITFTRQDLDKTAYRRYMITASSPGNDYGAIVEVLKKHYLHPHPLPDLILIDGGPGQVNAAKTVLSHLNPNLLILGITKGQGRKACFDRIYHSTTCTFMPLHADHEALHLLQYVRDEAHRYALSSHRQKRKQNFFASPLTQIPGIGPQRKKALLLHFGGLQGLKKASYESLLQVKGISPILAQRIKLFFK